MAAMGRGQGIDASHQAIRRGERLDGTPMMPSARGIARCFYRRISHRGVSRARMRAQQAVDEMLLAAPSEVLVPASAELPGAAGAHSGANARRGLGVDAGLCRPAGRAATERALARRLWPERARGGGHCRRRGAALRAHHAEERGAAHRQPAIPGALDGARTGPGDGAESGAGRAAFCAARTTALRSSARWMRA